MMAEEKANESKGAGEVEGQVVNEKEAGRKARPLGLGRGLSALLGSDAEDYASLDKVRTAKEVPIELLRPNRFQPRRHFADEAMTELVDSIREKGILQPILVRRLTGEPDQYEIIAGERRWRAAQKVGLHKVPVVIRDVGDAEALEVAIIENIQRSDLTPVDEALAYERLIKEFGHTQEQLGQIVGKSRSHVANLLRLLTLPPPVQEMLNEGHLTMGHARALVNASDPHALANQIVRNSLNVRAAEELARATKPEAKKPQTARTAAGKAKDPDIAALEKDLSEAIGMKCIIEDNGKGGGEIRVVYGTLEQLDDVCRRLCR